ncbi:hypothetical protein G7Z17_g12735 [Cylindrodendrum hubeiense]|uniref:DUF7924 domain-containing protein n=1 Tax=Cylindrodendrum hubeiense TaxID=595255 RepID=A0A9P5H0C0_9HYPO|nr:hypothetical protein G7Z17_g12735 [Cylindrodendrum hubeiense]
MQTRRSRLKPSMALQETLLDAAATASIDIGLPRTRGELHPDLMPRQVKKRQLNVVPEIDPCLAKKARVTQPTAQLTRGEPVEETSVAQLLTEELVSTTLQQPKPTVFNPQFSGIMKGFLNPAKPSLCPESVHAYISKWLESISIDADQDRWCRSDSQHSHSDDESVAEKLTHPAPEIDAITNTDEVITSPPFQLSCPWKDPAEAGSHYSSQVVAHTSSELVAVDAPPTHISIKLEHPLYRIKILGSNGIFMRPRGDKFPGNIAGLLETIRRDRDSPEPSIDQVLHDKDLEELALDETGSNVEEYFRAKILPGSDNILKRCSRLPMERFVPHPASQIKVTTPMPNILYGYRQEAFPEIDSKLISYGNPVAETNAGPIFPFFLAEFKVDDPVGAGSMWAATNECLGGSASCVYMVDRINRLIFGRRADDIQLIDTAAFSVTMNGREARLYVSWKHDLTTIYMQNVRSFLIQEPEQYLEFRKYVRKILEWGRDSRLKMIQKVMVGAQEERGS